MKLTRSEIGIAIGGFAALVFLIYRLTIGVDLSDESFYLANAKCIMDWGKPFAMTFNLSQPSIMLIVPFVQFWQNFLHMGDNGTILWLRGLYLLLSLGTGVSFFFYARTRVERPLALLLSFLPVVWIPYGLPALSYNTIGENCFFIGLLLCCLAGQSQAKPLSSALLAIPFIVACVAYPSLPLACAAFFAGNAIFAADAQSRISALVSEAVLLAAGAAIGLALVFICGWDNIHNSLAYYSLYSHVDQGHKLQAILSQLEGHYFPCFAVLAFASSIMLLSPVNTRWKSVSLLSLAAALIAVASLPTSMFTQSHAELALLAIFVLPLIIGGKDIPARIRIAMGSAWLAGLIVAFSSTNGFLALCVGAFPAICLGLCEVVRWQWHEGDKLAKVAAVSLISTTTLVLFFGSLNCVYGSDRNVAWSSLERMPSGPFRWLKTQRQKKEAITSLSKDLSSLEKQYQTIYFVGPPGYYVCSKLKPLDATFFHFDGRVFEGIKPMIAKFYADHGRPDVIVDTRDSYFGTMNSLDHEWIENFYSPLVGRRDYTIFVEKDVTQSSRREK